jgi:hypothetical protein
MQIGNTMIIAASSPSLQQPARPLSPSVPPLAEDPLTASETLAGQAPADADSATERPPEEVSLGDKVREARQLREEQRQIAKLGERDREVRAHEQAHAAVGGQYAGAPTYNFKRGPDGKTYAVGGEVSIDVSPVPNDPAATLKKMEIVQRAALAPAEPSAQDLRIAAQAQALAAQARVELAAMQREEAAAAREERQQAAEARKAEEEEKWEQNRQADRGAPKLDIYQSLSGSLADEPQVDLLV